MYEFDVLMKQEQNRDLLRAAENERLARMISNQAPALSDRALTALGNRLVALGQALKSHSAPTYPVAQSRA
jgi:hypothetical protein